MLPSVAADVFGDEPLTLDNVTDSIVPLIAAKVDTATLDALRASLASLANTTAVDAVLARIAAHILAGQPAVEGGPLKQRPITVFSVPHRLYGYIRYQDFEGWQERVVIRTEGQAHGTAAATQSTASAA